MRKKQVERDRWSSGKDERARDEITAIKRERDKREKSENERKKQMRIQVVASQWPRAKGKGNEWMKWHRPTTA